MLTAIPAFVVSLALAAVRIWAAPFAKAEITCKVDWIQSAGGPVLSFVLANVGRRKDTVRR